MRWHSLQVKLRQKIYSRLKEELRGVESEIEVSYCELEHGTLLGEDDETDEEIIYYFLNSLISSETHEDEMDETPDEQYYVFEYNALCMIACIEEYLSDVFIQKETENSYWTVRDYEEWEMLFKGITTEHNPIIKEVEMVMHHVD